MPLCHNYTTDRRLPVADTHLPDFISHDPGYQLRWEVSFDGQHLWFPIGTTHHEVYVTLAAPTGQRLESMYDIAVKNALGETTPSGALDAIWAKFATKSVQNKNGATLGYYRDPNGDECYNGTDEHDVQILTARALVNKTNGQCGAWIGLFGNALRIHGIQGQGINILPNPNFFFYTCGDFEINWRSNLRMLIQNWNFDTTPNSGCSAFPYRINHSCTTEWPAWDAPDVVPNPGTSGQNSSNPRSIFERHILYQANLNELIYDVAYGAGPFATLQDWEDTSVAGFATTVNLPPVSRLRGAMKHVPSVPHTLANFVTISEVAP